MTKVSIAVVVLLALAASAQAADSMPPQYRGAWCTTKTPDVLRKCAATRDEGDMVMTASGYRVAEAVCRHTDLTWRNPNRLRAEFQCTMIDGGDTQAPFTLDMRLGGDGKTLTMRLTP
jgi:opacity protein-like surface antigen